MKKQKQKRLTLDVFPTFWHFAGFLSISFLINLQHVKTCQVEKLFPSTFPKITVELPLQGLNSCLHDLGLNKNNGSLATFPNLYKVLRRVWLGVGLKEVENH